MAPLLRSFLSFISAPAFFHPLPTLDPRSHNIQISFAVPQPSYLFLKTSQFIFFRSAILLYSTLPLPWQHQDDLFTSINNILFRYTFLYQSAPWVTILRG
ncbi:uncharacterized protein F4817DRAFT_329110 [Daldinia loculata]|uniref:uncharacterized protein n=1 Tax=Daldinia loculata TaxID=103429 RepID=UPI0020C4DBFA|nr:uncharacterized protein F4817DRAFT_329110 [Daldinia loculata]KAI1649911.1 hypothetical protein F4817DRAFT_329110 [Daldinia loculata]